MRISVSNVSKSFRQNNSEIQILKKIKLDIAEGEVVALLGRSGSGKSTLLSLLAGLDRPNEGEIEIDGQRIDKMKDFELTNWRAQNIGIIFQQFHLVAHLTALENVQLSSEIKYGNVAENEQKLANTWLAKVGLSERENNYPSMLSGGEQQRVAIARALVHKPRLLLADEPSGNLDVETGKLVMDMLLEIVRANKMTLILVTHDEELARKTDRVVRLKSGECVND